MVAVAVVVAVGAVVGVVARDGSDGSSAMAGDRIVMTAGPTDAVEFEPIDPRRAESAGFSLDGPRGRDDSSDIATSGTTATGDAIDDDLPDLVDAAELDGASGECVMSVTSLRLGQSGASVECLQRALADAGAYTGALHGEFDQATFAAARQVQQDRGLFVDGVVGRETALSLGIWPDEEDLVVRTPPPPPGAVDLHGFPLSSVASAGSDAPPLPENSGSGKRVVYDRMGQRAWAVDADGSIVRSWLVSGSMYANELPGTHTVYSRSEWSTAWNGAAKLPLMIRWLQTERGHIGFHGIPIRVSDGTEYQTEDELGQRLSGGCQRQANRDAEFLWHFAPVGTTVVVV